MTRDNNNKSYSTNSYTNINTNTIRISGFQNKCIKYLNGKKVSKFS